MRAVIPTLLLTACLARPAGDFNVVSSQYLELLSFTGVSAAPCTITALFRHDGSAATRAIAAVGSSSTQRFQLEIDAASNLIARASSTGGSETASTGPGTIANEVWYHGAAVFVSTNSRIIYLNGVAMATNSNTIVTTSIDRVTVGTRRNAGSYGAYWDGQIAMVGVWNVALTAAEVATLANVRIAPLRIRPGNPVVYLPLVHVGTSNTWNAIGAPFSNIAGVGNAAHPTVLWP